MQKLSQNPTQIKLGKILENVGDMSLKRRAKDIIEALDLKNRDRILDLGCGTGYYLFLLSSLPLKLNLVGLDNDKNALKEAKQNLNKNIKFVLNNSEKLPFKDKSFDKVVASEVLEHIYDDQAAIKEVFRILKKGGKFVISTPSINYPFFWDPINWILQRLFTTHIKAGFFSGIWFGHVRLYEKQDLEKKFTKAGFKIQTSKELTWWCLPFNHYIINVIARLLYDVKISSKIADNLSKFKDTNKPFLINSAFRFVNMIDTLNNKLPQRHGVNVFISAIKP